MNATQNPGEILLTFGKYKNKMLKDCPRDYIAWLSVQTTICGKRDIPQAAKALLDTMRADTRPLRYPIPTFLEDAERLAWMAGKGNREARRTLLAARDEKTHCFMVEVVCEDPGYFKVNDDGTGRFIGSLAAIAEEEREEQEYAEQLAYWEAHPALDWTASNGRHIQVWTSDDFGWEPDGYEDEHGEWVTVYTVKIDGVKQSHTISKVLPRHRTWAKQNGVVACLGPVGLTQERLDALLAASKEEAVQTSSVEVYPDVCPRCRQTSCNGTDCQ